jgi:predicted nucleotidyltransferase
MVQGWKKGIHYWDTYAPVASWNSIRLLLAMTAMHKWHTTQLYCVLAFPQAPVERVLYMSIPKGFKVDGGKTQDLVLQLHKDVYGQKQAGRVWNQYLVNKLTKELKFEQSKVDECIFYRGKTMYALYTDDSILAGPDQAEIGQIIKEMQTANLDITIEGDLQDFLGVNIDKHENGSIHLTQPHLIDQILDDLRLNNDNVSEKITPATSSKLLSRHSDFEPFDNSFDYRSVIGKLNYLEKSSRSDIAYIVHQLARFSSDPKKEHGQALRWLGRYLKATRSQGTILRVNKSKDLEVYVDADFSGNWDPKEAQDRDTARSRHGYIITYAGCAILWKSQMQTEIALLSTESEYTDLPYALRDAIPIMELLKELKKKKFPVPSTIPNVHCKVFEDNSGALEMATVHKSRPRTKHLNVKLHHFRDYVTRKEISIHSIDTSMQLADYLTKAVNLVTLSRLHPLVMGW